MQEAMAKIRKELGEDAVILSTRRVRSGVDFMIEVTAARGDSAGRGDREKRISVGSSGAFEQLNGRMDELVDLVKEIKGETLRPDIQELKSTLGTVFDLLGLRNRESGYMTSIYYRLLANGVSSETAARLVDRIRGNPSNGHDRMKEIEAYLQNSIPVSVDLAWGRRAIAFVGPPGVGKTTTMAKLAARYAIEEKASVGLITTDTFKIGAAEQLKVFSRITGLPLEVVTGRAGREGLHKTIDKFADKDVVLIDTPGLSQANNHFEQLSDALKRDQRIKTHLLLSPAVARENSIAAARRFGTINYNSIILTKLDECTRFGSIYDIIDQVGKPVSYITTGQNIMQDIETADPGRIARLITENKLT